MKPKHIHFVCRGNAFRSRLAAAVFTELVPASWKISSSGIDCSNPITDTVMPYTAELARKHALNFEMTTKKHKSSDEQFAKADLVVFVSHTVFEEAKQFFDIDERKSVIWDVQDIEPFAANHNMPLNSLRQKIAAAEPIFQQIWEACDELAIVCKRGSWVDIVSVQNKLLGFSLPITIANQRGYWHRGVHIMLLSHDGKYVVEKRSRSILTWPDMLDISMGGVVDSGETPLTAARREVSEELGIELGPTQLKKLFVYHWKIPNGIGPNRSIVTTYVAFLRLGQIPFSAQKSEVGEVDFLTEKELKRLLLRHTVRKLGRLLPAYNYYRRVIRASKKLKTIKTA